MPFANIASFSGFSDPLAPTTPSSSKSSSPMFLFPGGTNLIFEKTSLVSRSAKNFTTPTLQGMRVGILGKELKST